MEKETSCLKCGRQLSSSSPIGRPKSYCSVGCRRAAGFEIRRLARRIETFEEQLLAERWDRSGLVDFSGRTSAERAADFEQALREAEGRLRTLLEGGSDRTTELESHE